MRGRRPWVIVLLPSICLALGSATHAGTPRPNAAGAAAATDGHALSRPQALKALGLARQGKYYPAIRILDAVLAEDPTYTKARFLRAKVHLAAKDYDSAAEDAERVVEEAPELKGAKQFLEKARAERKANGFDANARSATYSEWSRVWTIHGNVAFGLIDYKGAEGTTVFFFPADPGNRSETEPYETDSNDKELYFLRIVSLAGKDGKPDLTLPGAQAHRVPGLPYMILLDASGKEGARGSPASLQVALDRIRSDAAAKKRASAAFQPAADSRPAASSDFSHSDEPLESLAVSGHTTVVMVTSPG